MLRTLPLTVTVTRAPRWVGDPFAVEFRGVLPAGAQLVDHVARPAVDLPDGVRVLSADSLRVSHDTIVGHLSVALFRPDSEAIPAFVVAYRTADGTDTLTSAPLIVYVHPVLPIGNATLRDIRDVDSPWLTPLTVGAVGTIVVLGALTIIVLRRAAAARRRLAAAARAEAEAARPPSPYRTALAALDAIEHAHESVDRHYERVTDVVRQYLEAAHAIPALERTTPEVLGALPAPIANNGGGAALRRLLADADLVKFARLRPSDGAAGEHTARARSVLAAWEAHAVR